MGHQLEGKLDYIDEGNKLEAFIEFGKSRNKAQTEQDYFCGSILQDGKEVCQIDGNYLGYVDFNGVRYWDVREMDRWYHMLKDFDFDPLPSECSRRLDIILLKTKDAESA